MLFGQGISVLLVGDSHPIQSTLVQKPSKDDRSGVIGRGDEFLVDGTGEGEGSEICLGERRLKEDVDGEGKWIAERSDRRSGSGVVTRIFAPNCGVLATSKSASKSRSAITFREKAGVGSGAGNSHSSGMGVRTIFPKPVSSWRPNFLRSLTALRCLGSCDGVGDAVARSASSGGAVLEGVEARDGTGSGEDSARDGAGGGTPRRTSRVGRCRGRGTN